VAIGIGSAGAIFDPPGDLVTKLLATTAVLVPLVFVVLRLWRIALIERDDGLLVRNFFSTVLLHTERMVEIGTKDQPGSGQTHVIAFRMRKRRYRLGASATLTFSRQHATSICEALDEWAIANNVACGATGDDLVSRVF
jgi:hypothetical protein